VELSFYDVLSWVAVGFSVLFQSILFADNPVAAFCVYAAFICVVGTFIYYYHKAARRLKSKSSAGVISIKAIWEERKKKENILEQSKLTSPEELIMRNIVSSLKAHDGQKAKYNPRYSKIMESLKTKPALRKREEEKMIGEENDGLTIHSCPERLDRHKGRVLIRFNVSRDGDSSSSADEDAELSTRSTSRYASHNRKANNKLHDVVNSSWSDLRRVSKTRKNAAEFVKKLKEELGLDSDLSDFSSDRYPDEPFKFSSFEDNDSDGDKAMTEVATPELTSREVEIQREVVEVFTKPLSVKTFARRIRRHREKLHRLSLERRARDIEEEFKMSTRASRKSDLAHQTRAQTMLQKCKDERKRRRSDASECSDLVVESDVDVDPREVAGSDNHPQLQKVNSFELHNEKQAIVKSFAAHDSKRKKSLVGLQAEAKASLKRRVLKRNVEKDGT
jgi:hypothetical protein